MKSSKRKTRALALALVVAFSFALQACPDKDGPMEKAGEKVDEAVNDAKRSAEDATD
jgi:hypothetical protein